MCTASWAFREGGYSFLFNRDEQRMRPRASPPQMIADSGHCRLAPKDPKAGGSWIACNDRGVTVSLLNNYAAVASTARLAKMRSRGELPLKLANCASVGQFEASVSKMDYSLYPPFYLCCIDPSGDLAIRSWNGEILEIVLPSRNMITTSSFSSSEVQCYRENLFDHRKLNAPNVSESALMQYHMSADYEDAAYDPVMSRDDAETQCLSVISVDRSELVFDYYERVSNTTRFSEPNRTILPLLK